MATVMLGTPTRCATLAVTTYRRMEFLDLTDRIEAIVAESGLRQGVINIQSLHTTAAIIVNEHEPLLLMDFTSMLDRLAPRTGDYHHDDENVRTVNLAPDERPNGHAHCQALLLGTSACLNVVGGRPHLGIWQRVFLVELDGPRRREISIVAVGSFEDGDHR